MKITFQKSILGAVLLSVSISIPLYATAQAWPAKPIRLIVQFPAGGAADTITRVIAPPLAQALGQPVVVENRPGGSTIIGVDMVVKSAPDGYTLLLGYTFFMATTSAIAAVPAMRKTPPYDPLTAFTPIGKVGTFSYFAFTHSSVPAKTMVELIDYIRANPGKVNYAGATTTGIMAAVQLAGFAKLDMVRVPYKGEGPASVDLIGGRVQLMFGTPTNTLGAAKEGKLRVLATLLDKRSPVLPDVPTMPEANAPKLSIVPWAAFYGPPKLPAEIVSRVNRELNVVLARADVRELIERQVFDIQTSTPEELGAYTREQVESWKKAVADSGMPQE